MSRKIMDHEPQRDFVVLGGARPSGASEVARAALAHARGQFWALSVGSPRNAPQGGRVRVKQETDDLHWYRAAALLRQAAENAIVWLETEADHPRPDPHPAMRLQAAALRAAVAETFGQVVLAWDNTGFREDRP